MQVTRVLTLLLAVGVLAAAVSAKRTVVAVPGVGSSVLYCRRGSSGGFTRRWFVRDDDDILQHVADPANECFGPTDEQEGRLSKGKESYMAAVEHIWRPGGFLGGSAKIFERFRERAERSGWRRGVDLFGFPYDWRAGLDQSAREFLDHLAGPIGLSIPSPSSAPQDQGSSKIDVVCHGTGCLVVKTAMMRYPAIAGHIRVIIAVAPTWQGSATIIPLLSGFSSSAMGRDAMCHLTRHTRSTYEISLTHKLNWGKTLLAYPGTTPITSVSDFWDHIETIESDLTRTFSGASAPSVVSAAAGKEALTLINLLDAYDPPAWVSIFSLYGKGHSTAIGGEWDVPANQIFDEEPDKQFSLDGDGTTPVASATRFSAGKSRPSSGNFKTFGYRYDASSIIREDDVLDKVLSLMGANDALIASILAGSVAIVGLGSAYGYRRRSDIKAARERRRERRRAKNAERASKGSKGSKGSSGSGSKGSTGSRHGSRHARTASKEGGSRRHHSRSHSRDRASLVPADMLSPEDVEDVPRHSARRTLDDE